MIWTSKTLACLCTSPLIHRKMPPMSLELFIGVRCLLCGFAGVWKTRRDYSNAFFESYWRLEAVLTLVAFSAGLGFSIYALFWAR